MVGNSDHTRQVHRKSRPANLECSGPSSITSSSSITSVASTENRPRQSHNKYPPRLLLSTSSLYTVTTLLSASSNLIYLVNYVNLT